MQKGRKGLFPGRRWKGEAGKSGGQGAWQPGQPGASTAGRGACLAAGLRCSFGWKLVGGRRGLCPARVAHSPCPQGSMDTDGLRGTPKNLGQRQALVSWDHLGAASRVLGCTEAEGHRNIPRFQAGRQSPEVLATTPRHCMDWRPWDLQCQVKPCFLPLSFNGGKFCLCCPKAGWGCIL